MNDVAKCLGVDGVIVISDDELSDRIDGVPLTANAAWEFSDVKEFVTNKITIRGRYIIETHHGHTQKVYWIHGTD